MKTKFKEIVRPGNITKDKYMIFGCVSNYEETITKIVNIFNKTITIKIYEISLKPILHEVGIVGGIEISDFTKLHFHWFNHQKEVIKKDNKCSITLGKYIIAINIKNIKKYNKDRAFKKMEDIILE